MRLLERTSFLETLSHYATDARQGNGRLVLLSGESGMGKTVLIEAFQQRTANVRWLWGACDGIRTPRPPADRGGPAVPAPDPRPPAGAGDRAILWATAPMPAPWGARRVTELMD